MKGHDFGAVGSVAEQFDMLVSDREIRLLFLWAVVSPAAGIGYLIWLKYPKMKILAILAFALGLTQFYSNMPVLIGFFKQFGIVLRV